MIRNMRYRRDQRQMEEEEEIWFNEDEDFDVVPTNKPEMDPAYNMNLNKGMLRRIVRKIRLSSFNTICFYMQAKTSMRRMDRRNKQC